ncbi:MAG: type I DNA topoisomerase [Clostridiales bacterium]|nr:type I DNA topoisomerase [Clostridiales bacterium]
MSNLVIMESPPKAVTVKGYLGSGYKVVASAGHVRDLPKSTLGIDIEDDFKAKYINIRGKGPLIKELKKEAKNADKVYLATDPDREGEAIAWHLSIALDIPEEKIRRVTFNEITKKAVKAGIKTPRDIDMGLVNSQQARRLLDRIVGYKLSPFLWKTIKSGLSAGRVQSVATRIIVERENEIRAFNPEEYWTIDVMLENKNHGKIKAKFHGDLNGKLELHNEEEAMKVVNAVDGKEFSVRSVKKAIRMKNPAPPFTTSTLQQEGSRKLGFQSQKIMRVAQELYEGINLGSSMGGVQGLITYMRTDSLRIADEAADAAKAFIVDKYGEQFYPKERRIYKTKAGAQDAHEAIRPSNLVNEPDKIKKLLTTDQYKLYKLIWDRFMASQMASAELDTVTADIEAGGYIFRSSGYTVKFQGYMALYEETEEYTAPNSADTDTPEKSLKLPKIEQGDILKHDNTNPQKHFTEPPPRYNEASLVKFLEERGIGRPSTFATIITTIIARGYVVREGKSLKPTELGELTTKLMVENFSKIVDYEFTADMETDLDEIANGVNTMSGVLHSFYDDFAKTLETAENTVEKGVYELPVEETDIVCEKCGAKMVIKNGRYGKFAACPNYPICKNTKPLAKDGTVVEEKVVETDMVCEKCGSPMVMRTGRYGNFYACSRYPECKNTKQIAKEIGVNCPLCGAKIVVKKGKNRSVFYSCERYPECEFSSWDVPTNEKCPQCGDMLYQKKGKNILICKHEGCDYKREIEVEENEQDSEN